MLFAKTWWLQLQVAGSDPICEFQGRSANISNLETAAENVLPIVSQSLDFVIVPRNDHTSACNDQWSRENGRSEPAKLSACRRSD